MTQEDAPVTPSTSTPSADPLPQADTDARLRLLPSATRRPVSAAREADLRVAETSMLLHDYSQLPVMTGDRTVHGLISWKSIGRAHLTGAAGPRVADCMDTSFRSLHEDTQLLSAVDEIIRHEVVLVHSDDRRIVGIVTTADLSMHLHDLTAAFLIIGRIEMQIRRLLGDRFDTNTLRSVVTPDSKRDIRSAADLSFGEYVRLLQVPEHWATLSLKVDRGVVLERLEEVREIRNAVMHFRPETVASTEIENLRATEAFLRNLRPDA